MSDSIFRENIDGKIEFVGDFNGFYSEVEDPWGQSNNCNTDMTEYYLKSRNLLITEIENICLKNNYKISEVGCGLGYVLKELYNKANYTKLYGYDISNIAIEKAKILHSDIAEFTTHDIIKCRLPKSANVIILSNILWYILDDIMAVLDKAINSLYQPKMETCILLFIMPFRMATKIW